MVLCNQAGRQSLPEAVQQKPKLIMENTEVKKAKSILVRDLKVGDKVKIAKDSPTYTVKEISPYGTSYHSLIVEFDKMLPDGMACWHFDTLTELELAE